jgi:hypothetical protein
MLSHSNSLRSAGRLAEVIPARGGRDAPQDARSHQSAERAATQNRQDGGPAARHDMSDTRTAAP